MHEDASLAVEHVKPKKPDGTIIPGRELEWDNFLLACANCNSTKGDTEVELNDYLWPDRENTFIALKYSEGGFVSPADGLDDELKQLAINTIKLTGLDKQRSNDPTDTDRRSQNRREKWDIAQRSKERLLLNDTEAFREQIVETALGHGYWSIWMTVFKDDADMLQRFIQAFPGTCAECFDSSSGFVPIHRHGGQC
jgi:5-methylcytosine-specific restriction endonuclease McrA